MLTFTLYYLLKNPEAMRKLREEIDTTLGGRPMTVQDVNTLPYLIGEHPSLDSNVHRHNSTCPATMRESLRLGPSAPARTVMPVEDTVIGGKYAVKKGSSIIINAWNTHRDPKMWGEDVCRRVYLMQAQRDSSTDRLQTGRQVPSGAHARL